MDWRTRLLDASFRGVPFQVDSAAYQGGRRAQVHEYPGRDVPLVEDLGRRARRFTVEALVLGPDYDFARDNLLAALEQSNAGTLIHPYLGRLQVQAMDVSLHETTSEGGLARFTIAFQEAGTFDFVVTPDTAGQVKSQATTFLDQAQQAFLAAYKVASLPGNYVSQLQADVSALLGGVEQVVSGAAGSAAALIRAPADLAASIAGSIASIRSALNDPLRAFGVYKGLFSAAPATAALTATPSRRAQAVAQDALMQLVRQSAAGEAANALAAATFDSAAQAAELRDALLDALDGLAGEADAAAYRELAGLRAAVVRDIAARGADLARMVSYTPPATLPALAIAQRLYGDATRDADIVARNRLRHPGFVPGGLPIEVLSNA
jgi:prophage DNA circulation protein